jgi:ubiquitin C-terminal hydrolase
LLIFINGKLYQHHFNVPLVPVNIFISKFFSLTNIYHYLVRSPSREGTKAQKRLLISKLPQVLHVVLRRFRSLPQTTLRRPTSRQARQLSHKITLHVNFDEYLDMAPYCTESTMNSFLSTRSKQYETTPNECLYRLRGVIVHYGKSINTGHFVAFVHNDSLGKIKQIFDFEI